MRESHVNPVNRAYLMIVAAAAAVAAVGAVFATMLAGESSAAPAVAPSSTAEPQVTGTPRVGQVLRTTRGNWNGTEPIDFAFRWYRCNAQGGASDASDCRRIANAENASYVLRQADAGVRIRSQVVATNDDGSARATSNATPLVQSARPFVVREPSISGTARVGSTLQANRGEWGGETPMTFAFAWLRCSNPQANNCSEIPGANDTSYEVRDADSGRSIRVRVTARNDAGSRSAVSNPTGVVGGNQPEPPASGAIDVSNLQASGDRLVVASVQFSPNPVTSRTAPITARVRVTVRNGRPVVGARVFMRATPRVVQGQTAPTQADGTVTLTLVPNRLFPQPRSGRNVQFFIKASRPGDPPLGGVAGYRLVQVRLAG